LFNALSLNASAQILVPAAAALIMFCLGLGLDRSHFINTFRQTRLLAVGLICPIFLLPLLALLLVRFAALDRALATGLVLVAACPVASPVNLLTLLARANVAFTVTLTVLTSLTTAVTIPLALAAMDYVVDGGSTASMSLWRMSLSLALLSAVPVLAGMLVHALWPGFTRRLESAAVQVACVAFALGIALAIAAARNQIPLSFSQTGLAALTLNASAIAVSCVAARLARLNLADTTAVILGASTRRFTVASFAALTLCRDPRLLIPAIAYCLIMWVSAMIVVQLALRRVTRGRQDQTDPLVAGNLASSSDR
jgi:bile acid:Na+ symporter, BASS family